MQPTPTIEDVAAYIRVSHEEQKLHGLSLDAQVQRLTEYAAAHGLRIVAWYRDEGVSGRKLIRNRPELQRMIRDAQKHLFQRIIFIKLDRFFRSVAEYHECMKLIEPVTWTATEEKYDMATASGRAFVNMKLTIAELEADQTGERIRLVNDYKVKSGQPLYGSHSLPFCYQVEQVPGSREKRIVKRDAEIMEDLIAFYMENRSIRKTMQYINRKYNKHLWHESISRLLRNELIAGAYRGNPQYCEPYVTREQFDELQRLVAYEPRSGTNEYHYIFSGMFICPECGRHMSGVLIHSKKRDRFGNKYAYRYYRCNFAYRGETCSCKHAISERKAERFMMEGLVTIIARKKSLAMQMQAQREQQQTADVNALRAELDRLNYAWQKGRIRTVEEYDRRYDELAAQIAAAEAPRPDLLTEDYSSLDAFLDEQWKATYVTLDNEHKRAFWRSFIKAIHPLYDPQFTAIRDIDFL